MRVLIIEDDETKSTLQSLDLFVAEEFIVFEQEFFAFEQKEITAAENQLLGDLPENT